MCPELENLRVVRGNTDRYIVTGEGPTPTLEQARADPELVDLYARVTGSFSWTRGFVTSAGWFDWLERLPLEVRLTLPDGSRLLAVHASPGLDEGEGIHPGQSNARIARLVEDRSRAWKKPSASWSSFAPRSSVVNPSTTR